MTPNEIKKKLDELGLGDGKWKTAPGQDIKLEVVEKQKQVLGSLRNLLQNQIKEDQQKIENLLETLNKIKHGGGR